MQIEEALKHVKQKDPGRFNHILGVVKKAEELALHYQVDPYKCQLAAAFHDYAKHDPLDRQRKIIETHFSRGYLNHSVNVFHGPVGRYLVELEFMIKDNEILDAIEYHVTGHPKMTDVAKIVYVSDYIEEGRTHEPVDFCRYLSLQSLDIAVLGVADSSLTYLRSKQAHDIHPLSIETYEKFLEKVGVTNYEFIKNNYYRSR